MAPYDWNGANFIYYRFLRPFVKKHEKKIDAYIAQGGNLAQQGQSLQKVFCSSDRTTGQDWFKPDTRSAVLLSEK